MAEITINNDLFTKQLIAAINAQIVAAAEPIIQEALKQAEIEMRKKLAVIVVGMMEKNYSMERFGNDLRIIVRFDDGKSHGQT